uniref:Uncharacterized protein n=1 Tax=viral metagenome TaxID=1070528 RepID=A0A6C0IRA2_9ZZZZ
MSANPRVITTGEWDTAAVRYMKPRVSDRGLTTVSVISGQTGRSLYLSTPLIMTWGVSDYVDEKTGESDGKFKMSLAFPGADYSNKNTDTFLQKLKEFETRIIDDAVVHSEAWFGTERSREFVKETMFPFLKYPKDKITKKIDETRPPSMSVKVPCYQGQWQNLEIYNTKQELLFPSDNENETPIDLIPKKSQVACVIQCGGIWTTGKAWGVSWKLGQCVVKPVENATIFGKCNVQLSVDDINTIDTQKIDETEAVNEDEVEVFDTAEKVAQETAASDSDEEDEPAPAPAPEPAPKKKVVKKSVPVATEEDAPAPAPKKKVVKKKVAAE